MPDSVVDQARRLGVSGRNIGNQVRRLIDRILTEHELARRVFVGDDGKLTRAADEWLRRLARENYVESTTFVGGDRDMMMIREGHRRLAMKILRSVNLDTERLASLTRLEREVE